LGEKNQKTGYKIAKVESDEIKPYITPSTINWLLINQSLAPTNFIIFISSREL